MTSPSRTAKRIVLAAAAIAVLVVAFAAPASAHRNDESYLYLDVGEDTLSGRVEMPYPDLRTVFDLRIEGSEDEVREEIEANLDMLQRYADDETSIGADGASWGLAFDDYELLDEAGVGANGLGYVILPFTVDLPVASVPRVLDVTFTPMLDEIDNRNNIVLVANDWQRGVIDEETNELLIVNSSSPSGSIDLGDPSQWRNFTASIDLGVDHIRTGPDHIFFILVLLLTSVLVLRAGKWSPSPSFVYSLGRLVIVATMFTLAHSITFTLAGLDLIPLPPSKFVESVIALSIGAAALHNLRPVLGHREWALAFVFGLFHGMGFAGLVEDLDISRSTQLVSLLGRNVGIEIGQLVIIGITFPGLYLLRRTRLYRPLLVVSSLVLAVISFTWVIERVFELDAGINGGILKAVEWPRSLVYAIVFTVAAAGIREWEKRQGRLVPFADAEPEPEPEPSNEEHEDALV
jgi:hypothetical protein